MDFYVYLHRKPATGEAFYVGKGSNDRAWNVERNIQWKRTRNKHGLVVEIIASGLQEWYALELEMNLIAYYGRADLGKGTLLNKTDGGDGCKGLLVTEETKELQSKNKSKWLSENPDKHPMKYPSARKKISEGMKGENHPMKREKSRENQSRIMKERFKEKGNISARPDVARKISEYKTRWHAENKNKITGENNPMKNPETIAKNVATRKANRIRKQQENTNV